MYQIPCFAISKKRSLVKFLWGKTSIRYLICIRKLNLFSTLSMDAIRRLFGAPRQFPLKSSANILVEKDWVQCQRVEMQTYHPKDPQNHYY